MSINDRFTLTPSDQQLAINQHFIPIIHALSRFEDVQTTREQTKAIVNGDPTMNVSPEDQAIVLRLKRGLTYIIEHDGPYQLQTSLAINDIVAQDEALDWGTLRTGQIQIGGVDFVPPIPVQATVEAQITRILASHTSLTYRALLLMFNIMRAQLFWDGNKRTAFLTANYLMSHAGVGLVYVTENQLTTFHQLLSAYYEAGAGSALTKLIQWTAENCIHGPSTLKS